MPKADWDEDDYFPNIGGQGSLHDLNDYAPEPRLWFAKSVSPSAARALNQKPEPNRRPMGFHLPRHR